MARTGVYVLGGALFIGLASTIVFALEQDRPGQMWPAKVWIQNHTKEDAVAVSIQDVGSGTPLRVQLAGAPAVTLSPPSRVQTRADRQVWEYRTLTVTAGQDPIGALQSAGADGWETTGLQFPSTAGVMIVLKRPR